MPAKNTSLVAQPVSGRPPKLSRRIIRDTVRKVESGLLKNAKDTCDHIFNLHNIKLSKWTIARLLIKNGLKSYSKPKKPRLESKHKKARHKYARVMKQFQEDAWQRVIFTDESRKMCIRDRYKTVT